MTCKCKLKQYVTISQPSVEQKINNNKKPLYKTVVSLLGNGPFKFSHRQFKLAQLLGKSILVIPELLTM